MSRPADASRAVRAVANSPALRRDLARQSIVFFDSYYCSMRYAAHREELLTTLVDDYVDARMSRRSEQPKKIKRLILEPRDHGKTEAVITFVTDLICEDRDVRVLFAGETIDRARERVGRVKSLLRSKRVTRDYCSAPAEGYGPFLPARGDDEFYRTKWGESAITVIRSIDAVDPTLRAAGVRTAMTGGHYDVIVVDDPVAMSSVKNLDRRRELRDWLKSTVTPMLAPGGLLIVIGTRKHHDDLYAHLLRDPTWRKLERKAILRFPDKAAPVYALDEHGIEELVDWDVEGDHEVLWPEERPLKYLLTEREGIRGDEGLGYTGFGREYQNEVMDEEDTLFKRRDLDPATKRGERLRLYDGPWPRRLLIVQGWDLAFVTDRKHAERRDTNYTVGVTLGADVVTRERYLMGIFRDRGMAPRDQKLAVIREYQRFAPPADTFDQSHLEHIRQGWVFAVGMETNHAGNYVSIDVGEAADIPLVGAWTGREVSDAFKGVPAISSLFERRKVIIPYATRDTREAVDVLVRELHELGTARHDDTVLAFWIAEVLLRKALGMFQSYIEANDVDLEQVLAMAA